MTLCYRKHPFAIETEDRLVTINTKIFEIKKKIQLSEGQRKSNYEENEAEKQQNNDLISTLKKEIKLRLEELAQARAAIGDDEGQVKKYLSEVCPIGNKSVDQLIHNLDLKVIEQRKALDLLKYEKKNKRNKLRQLEREYENLLIESTKSDLVKSKNSSRAKKKISHLENEIHKVLIQWTEAELVKKKYCSIRQALIDDSVKFESSLSTIEELLLKQQEEIKKLENVREEASEMRYRAAAATATQAARAHDAEHARATERAFFAQRFNERKRELEKLEKRIFPPPVRPAVRPDSSTPTEAEAVAEETSAVAVMEEIFQRLMKLTGVTDAEEVFDRFRAQRETGKRLSFLQQSTEEEKLQLEAVQAALMAELEAFKFASVKDKDEGQDQILELKEEIRKEEEILSDLQQKLHDLENVLLEIKRLLYELCKILDVIPDPAMPEWTAEARDVQQLVAVLTARYERACARANDIREKGESVAIAVPSNPTSGSPSVANISVHSQTTAKESEKAAPTYMELVQREPVKGIDKEYDKNQKSILPPLPTYFANNMDFLHARIGYGPEGLKILIREINSHNRLKSWQAIHSIEQRVQISEDALFLIRHNVLDRLLNLMMVKHPFICQQICFIIMHISTYLQGREKIMRRPIVMENLLKLTVNEHEQDIRYSAAIAIRTMTRSDRPACIYVSKTPKIVPKLLGRVLNDHAAIILHHMRTLEALFEMDPETGIRENAFEVMMKLFHDRNSRILSGSLDCLAQLCAHPVGRRIADEKDLTVKLRHYLKWPMANVIISALGLLAYTTISERAKWRAREFSHVLPKMLISLCFRPNKPIMQLRAMQVLTNLCDLPDLRNCMKSFNKRYTEDIEFRSMEKFKGHSECTSYGLETSLSYKTMCRELTKIIRANRETVNRDHVHSYKERLRISKKRLIYAVNQRTYNDAHDDLPKE